MPDRGKRQRGPETRTALLRAATTVVERDGIAAATTRRIAEEAGLPLGTVHYWFADKSDLLEGVIDLLLEDVRAGVAEERDTASVRELLARLHERYTTLSIGRQLALFEITTHALRTEGMHNLARDQYRAYTEAAREGITPWADQADRTLPGGAPALAALAVAVMDGLTLSSLAAPGDPDRAAALDLFAHLLDRAGLGAEAEPTRPAHE
ncbi:TetR/AcrR family transcriptional regulator [Microbacterium sp. RURRCA19A]|uniref:TetR/AcrR family transcriptional regulator n=1 Tax=Microbacterium sp. RURRCA19A TaxID=1907391 RepID=UPI000956ADD8|nr:TetR family transcriptional regulator [Microbacterium sp. RURRCA19A]SIR95592.1 transcriptional regulator, TetR family [Microbacterium sp. RURRCA19A]